MMLDFTVATARVLLGAVLLVAGVGKVRDPKGFASAVRAFGLVPARSVTAVARALPVVEILIAVLLLGGVALEPTSFAAVAMLAVFTVGIVINLRRGNAAPCACFGASDDAPLRPSAVVRNIGLLACGLVILSVSIAGTGDATVADILAGSVAVLLLVAGWQLSLAARSLSAPLRQLYTTEA